MRSWCDGWSRWIFCFQLGNRNCKNARNEDRSLIFVVNIQCRMLRIIANYCDKYDDNNIYEIYLRLARSVIKMCNLFVGLWNCPAVTKRQILPSTILTALLGHLLHTKFNGLNLKRPLDINVSPHLLWRHHLYHTRGSAQIALIQSLSIPSTLARFLRALSPTQKFIKCMSCRRYARDSRPNACANFQSTSNHCRFGSLPLHDVEVSSFDGVVGDWDFLLDKKTPQR